MWWSSAVRYTFCHIGIRLRSSHDGGGGDDGDGSRWEWMNKWMKERTNERILPCSMASSDYCPWNFVWHFQVINSKQIWLLSLLIFLIYTTRNRRSDASLSNKMVQCACNVFWLITLILCSGSQDDKLTSGFRRRGQFNIVHNDSVFIASLESVLLLSVGLLYAIDSQRGIPQSSAL